MTPLTGFFSNKDRAYVATFAALLGLLATIAQAEESIPPALSLEEAGRAEVIWDVDPYYTAVAFFFPLTSLPVPTISSDSEVEIYKTLINGSAIPRYMLLEASVYPLPVLGTTLKRRYLNFYDQWVLGNGSVNLLESATAGFQEPWAVSAFFGNIANLVRPGESRTGNNLGYTGYLLSAGAQHIKDNVLISDNWYELEWKIKGERDYPNDKLKWSFRVGGKIHANPEITDVVYIALHRSNLNTNFPFLNWVTNTELDLKMHFSQIDGKLVRGEVIAGKKYPIANKNYTPTLNVGFVWSSQNEYSGELADRNKNTFTLVFRPSVVF